MSLKKLNASNFNTEIRESNGFAIVDFYAEWCGPCKMLAPVIDTIAEEHSDIVVGKVNVDESPQLAALYNVKSIPTVIYFKDGVEYARSLGYKSKQQILSPLAQ